MVVAGSTTTTTTTTTTTRAVARTRGSPAWFCRGQEPGSSRSRPHRASGRPVEEVSTGGRPQEARATLARRAGQALVATAACAAAFFGAGNPAELNSALAVSGGRNGNNSTPISNSDFSGQNLTESDFTKTIMKQCNFDGANLRGVSLFAAFAEGSTFRNADLSFADLEQGNFEDSDFTDAVLEGAQVSAARFDRAVIENSDWTDVVLRKDVQQFLCRKPSAKGTNPVTGADTRESLMC